MFILTYCLICSILFFYFSTAVTVNVGDVTEATVNILLATDVSNTVLEGVTPYDKQLTTQSYINEMTTDVQYEIITETLPKVIINLHHLTTRLQDVNQHTISNELIDSTIYQTHVSNNIDSDEVTFATPYQTDINSHNNDNEVIAVTTSETTPYIVTHVSSVISTEMNYENSENDDVNVTMHTLLRKSTINTDFNGSSYSFNTSLANIIRPVLSNDITLDWESIFFIRLAFLQ
jgi:hypothetical protein